MSIDPTHSLPSLSIPPAGGAEESNRASKKSVSTSTYAFVAAALGIFATVAFRARGARPAGRVLHLEEVVNHETLHGLLSRLCSIDEKQLTLVVRPGSTLPHVMDLWLALADRHRAGQLTGLTFRLSRGVRLQHVMNRRWGEVPFMGTVVRLKNAPVEMAHAVLLRFREALGRKRGWNPAEVVVPLQDEVRLLVPRNFAERFVDWIYDFEDGPIASAIRGVVQQWGRGGDDLLSNLSAASGDCRSVLRGFESRLNFWVDLKPVIFVSSRTDRLSVQRALGLVWHDAKGPLTVTSGLLDILQPKIQRGSLDGVAWIIERLKAYLLPSTKAAVIGAVNCCSADLNPGVIERVGKSRVLSDLLAEIRLREGRVASKGLARIVRNAGQNAGRYGDGSFEVQAVFRRGEGLSLTFANGGLGMESDFVVGRLGRIGEREGRRPHADSHGDGFASMVGIARERGWSLWVWSEPGQGAKVRIDIPEGHLELRSVLAELSPVDWPTRIHPSLQRNLDEGFVVPEAATSLARKFYGDFFTT